MITAEEIGSQKLYDAILNHMKNNASFFKKITMKGISKKDARECGWLSLQDMELKDLSMFPALKAMTLHDNHFSDEEKERLTSLYPAIYFGFESGEVD